ncbi:His Kinase A (phospho-acceptor) domain-containing protein [Parapedobacter indicus]|uniref:histidine kinase n=2 Tax=Parapedobacter indicus TaxID=1477437 RepID=A0A1I3N275_9SPHI|nr:phospho-acceptor domain-containing protein [Parapedobacter indicus]SFJ03110.1 His Kinase A (phospho-acceptor) domain-containing protein [Parapedobacter indicus]
MWLRFRYFGMRKPLVLFYFLVFYATAQLVWWGVLLIESQPDRKAMIIGEGIFFMLIFMVGALKLKRAFVREHKIQQQQQNFLLAVTHELKSPLASIKLAIQTILKRDLSKEQRDQFLSNSLKDIERLDDLVGNVLIATKLENLRYNFPKEQIDLTELVKNVAGRLQIHSCTSQVIKTELQSDIQIEGDRFAITNVVTNLIENAVKYSPPCAHVVVKLAAENGNVLFSVADHGIGIADHEKKLIFNKFYRVGNEDTRKTKGTGLGLYIVKTVLERHRAQISIKDNVPSGSIFEVIFNSHYATN